VSQREQEAAIPGVSSEGL